MARRIELREEKMTMPQTGQELDFLYVDQLIEIAKSAPREGLTMDDIIKAGPLIAKLKQHQDEKASEVLLEDSEYTLLMSKLKLFRFTYVDTPIVDFINYINDVPEIGVSEVG